MAAGEARHTYRLNGVPGRTSKKSNRDVIMSFRYLMAGAIFAFAALPGPAAAQAQAYPWCTEGSAIHCYYMTLQQCEETVDFHGFCIRNPDYQERSDVAPGHSPQ